MNDFHFLRPEYLLLFIPFLILFYLYARHKRLSSAWDQICSKELLPYVIIGKSGKSFILNFLILSAGVLLITALAGPSWQQISQPVIKTQSGLVIALDLSPSMNGEDVKPSRLKRAIYKIEDLLTLRKEGQTALLVFSEDPYVVTPLTDDVATIKNLLGVLDPTIMPSQGNQAHKAVTKAAQLLSQAGITNGSVLLVTSELSKEEMEKSVDFAIREGISISVLGVGTEEGSPIPNQQGGFLKDSKGGLVLSKLSASNLSHLAQSTGGGYQTFSADDTDIAYLDTKFVNRIHTDAKESIDLQTIKWHDQGYWLVLLALPFVSLFFRRGIWLTMLLLFSHPLIAEESPTTSNLWQTPDQKAEALFHQEEYQQARELFQNPDWQAAASYKLGNYEAAERLFQTNESADGYYNYGNAQAKQQKYKEAIESYEKTLALQPDHEDALYNKKIIEEFLKQENKDNKDQNNQKQDDKKNQNQDKQNDQKDGQDGDGEGNQDPSDNENSKDSEGKDSKQENQSDSSGKDQEQDEKQNQELEKQYRDSLEKERQKNEAEASEKEGYRENESAENDPQQQVDEQWLERVPDDPGALLRRKFLHQYRQNSNKPTK